MFSLVDGGGPTGSTYLKATAGWQEMQWYRRPTVECWPEVLDVAEAAAFLRVHPDLIRRALKRDRAGQAALAHQRIGGRFRVLKADLLAWGRVNGRPILTRDRRG
jgi:hypothetical protein